MSFVIIVKSDGTFEYSDRLRPVNEDFVLVERKNGFRGGKKETFLKTIDAG